MVGAAAARRVTQKVEPCPGKESTPMTPPMTSTRCFDRARPTPVPSTAERSAPSLGEGDEQLVLLLVRDPGPGVAHLEPDTDRRRRDRCGTTTEPPRLLYLTALDPRLSSTWSRR